jgi:hypothetical protein
LYDKFAGTRQAEFERGLQEDDKKNGKVLDKRLKAIADAEKTTNKGTRKSLLRFTAKDKHRILANELMIRERKREAVKERKRNLERKQTKTAMEKYEEQKQKDLDEKMSKTRTREENDYKQKRAARAT